MLSLYCKMSASGVLLHTIYRRVCPLLPALGAPSSSNSSNDSTVSTGSSSSCYRGGTGRVLSDAELEAVRVVWDRNAEQVRVCYSSVDGWWDSVVMLVNELVNQKSRTQL